MSNVRFDFPPAKERESRPYHLLYVSSACYDKDWNGLIHSHNCTEIFFCVAGKGEVYANERSYPIQAGELFIIDAGVDHAEYSDAAKGLEYLVLGVEGLRLQFPSLFSDDGFAVMSFADQTEEVLFYLKTILKEADSRQPHYADICACIFDILLITISRLSSSIKLSENPRRTHEPEDRRCLMVRQYIDEYFGEKITLDRLAQMVHINKYHLVHLFREQYGTTPIHYLNSKRLEESCFMLKNTNLSISQIALLLGFSSLSYFAQCFRSEQHMTPSEYRARYSHSSAGLAES